MRSDERLEAASCRLSASCSPKVIVCYAQAGAALARYVIEHGQRDWDVDPGHLRGRAAVCPPTARCSSEAFGPAVFETYGSREVMLIAAECEAHDGMHLSMENLIVELVVRETAARRAGTPGELGEVVVTDLHNYGTAVHPLR